MELSKHLSVSTLAAIRARHEAALTRLKLSDQAIVLMTKILEASISGATVSPEQFRRDHRRKTELINQLAQQQLIASVPSKNYELNFSGFCVLILANKRVATSLVKDMQLILRRAMWLLNQNPGTYCLSYEVFVEPIPRSRNLTHALRLLSTSVVGVHFNERGDETTVQFSEEVFKAKNLYAVVSAYLEMISTSSISNGRSSPLAIELNTFSLQNLLMVEEAYRFAQRALSEHIRAPDSAISSAKSTLEATLKFIAHQERLDVSHNPTLPALYKACRQSCGLGSDATHKMGRSIASLCNEIAEARNQLGDGHAKAPGSAAPTRSEARFIVGIALHLAESLIERYEAARLAR